MSEIALWHVGTQELIHTLVGHAAIVPALVFSQDGKILVSGSSDKTVKIWRCD